MSPPDDLDARTAIPLAVLAFTGSFVGARVAAAIPKEAFTPIIMGALVLVGAYTLLKKDLGREARMRFDGREHLAVAGLAGAAIGFYDAIGSSSLDGWTTRRLDGAALAKAGA